MHSMAMGILLMLAAAAALTGTSSAAATATKPNFVVFFADDMGWSQPSRVSDQSPWAGDNGTIATPNLDR